MALAAWIGLAAALGAASPGPRVRANDVLITEVSPRPPFSGVLRTFVVLEGRVGQIQDRFYQPYMHGAQFVPAVGARCTIIYRNERFDQAPDERSDRNVMLKIIDEMRCGSGHFSMAVDGLPPQRRP
jgi:hypothetical protein